MASLRERRSREIRSARASSRPPSFAVTLVALAIVFSLAWVFFLRSSPAAPTPQVEGTRGTYTWRPPTGQLGQDGTFGAVASGDAGGRAEGPEGQSPSGDWPLQSAYAAATRTETTLAGTRDGHASSSRTVGAWPPVWRVATRSPLDYQGLAAIVRSAVEDGDDAVGIKPLKDGDRTVWRAAMRLNGGPIELVVDQVTGLVTWYSDGGSTFTAKVDWASPPPADETFAVQVPAGTAVLKTTDEDHTYASSPAAAGRAAGYDPLVSDLAPDGYALKAVATIRAELRPVSWISDKVWSLPVDLPGTAVLELYTQGLSQFTVEQVGPATLRALAGTPDWQGEAGTDTLSYQETTLQYGAFGGATASTWYQESGPSLFVAGRRRAVFVTGALTRQELIAFAEGLKPVPAAK